MKISLRFIAIEASNLPPADSDGGWSMDVADGMTVGQALESLALPDDATYLTLVNEESIPGTKRFDRALREGDLLTVFSPIKGG